VRSCRNSGPFRRVAAAASSLSDARPPHLAGRRLPQRSSAPGAAAICERAAAQSQEARGDPPA
jgi:hypothetical protein